MGRWEGPVGGRKRLCVCAVLVLTLQVPTYKGAPLEWSVWDGTGADPREPQGISGAERRSLMGRETILTEGHVAEANPILSQPGWLATMQTAMTPAKMVVSRGFLFITGSFKGCMVVGESRNMTSKGSLDMFAAKITFSGTWLAWWSIGGTRADAGYGLAVDDEFVYVTMQAGSKLHSPNAPLAASFSAWNRDTTTSASLHVAGSGMVYKIRHIAAEDEKNDQDMDLSTLIAWVSPSSESTVPRSCTEDVDGGVIVTGNIISGGMSTFGAGPGAKEVDFGDCDTTGHCAYIEKISSSGTVMWAGALVKSMSYGRETKFTHISLLHQNPSEPGYYDPQQPQYVLVVGGYALGAQFYNNETDLTTRVNNYGDIFVSKITNTGTMVFLHKSGSVSGGATAYDASINVNGDLFLVGVQSGTTGFGKSVTLYVEGTYQAAFVCKFDPSGSGAFLSAYHILSSLYDSYATSVAADLAANTLVLGYFNGVATFGKPKNKQGDGLVMRSAGLSDVFLIKINNLGTMLWAANVVQGKGENMATTVVSDLFGISAYYAGSFKSRATFGYDDRLAVLSAPANNLPDAFLMQFKDPITPGASMAYLARSIQSSDNELHVFTGDGDASRAVDGVPDPNYASNSCSSTGEMLYPWWSVDLFEELDIGYIKIYNSASQSLGGNPLGTKQGSFEIRIGNTPPVPGDRNSPLKNPACLIGLELNASDIGIYRCTGMKGRYVTVRATNDGLSDAVMSICELEVYVGPKYVGCSAGREMVYEGHGKPVQVDSYLNWNLTRDSSVELCDKVCRMPKYYAVPSTLTPDTAEEEVGAMSCACDVMPPTNAEQSVEESACGNNKMYLHQSRANFAIRAPPVPNSPPPAPYLPPSPPLPPSLPFPPFIPAPPPKPPWVDPFIVSAFLWSGLVLLLFLIIIPAWYRLRTRGLEDPFWSKRGKAHNANDPDQEIDATTITTNPSWRGKVWNGLTYGGMVYNPMQNEETSAEVERAADITPIGLGQTSSTSMRQPSTRV